jgi:low affinity Fe/Cu permease
MSIRNIFNAAACRLAIAVGRPGSFITAATVVLLWALSGPLFHFDETWQLIINTSTTIVTFLMVFLIQHAQNRDSEAVQIKLDELLKAVSAANNRVINIENLDDEKLDEIRRLYNKTRSDGDAGAAKLGPASGDGRMRMPGGVENAPRGAASPAPESRP